MTLLGQLGTLLGQLGTLLDQLGTLVDQLGTLLDQSRSVMNSHGLFQITVEWFGTVRAISGRVGGYHDQYVC